MAKKRKITNEENISVSPKNNFIRAIEQATKELYYVSEIDAEIEPFIGKTAENVTKEEILRQTGNSPSENVEERDFKQIFERLSQNQDWFGEEEKARAKRFEFLGKMLSENLKDLKFFKIGEVEKQLYFVGLDKSGKLTGIQTKAVET